VKLERERFRLDLDAGELLRLEEPRGVEVVCESGRLWITQEAQSRDIWLRAGESYLLESCGLALLEAERPTRLRLNRAV
jgi:hypothetical protein